MNISYDTALFLPSPPAQTPDPSKVSHVQEISAKRFFVFALYLLTWAILSTSLAGCALTQPPSAAILSLIGFGLIFVVVRLRQTKDF